MMPEIVYHGNGNIFFSGVHAEGHARHGAVQNTGSNNRVIFTDDLVKKILLVGRHPELKLHFSKSEQFADGFDAITAVCEGFAG